MASPRRQPAARLRPITPDDLHLLRQLIDCRLSPDGTMLLTSIDEVNREERRKSYNLYSLPLTKRRRDLGSSFVLGGALQQFTRGQYSDRQPRFSPDGSLVAFMSNRSESSQVHLMPTGGGESWQLTKFPGNVIDFAWSPDGRSILVNLSPRDADEIEREKMSKAGRKGYEQPTMRHITRLHYRMDGGGFFPKGQSELHIVDIVNGRTRELVKDGKDNHEASFSPDGKYVVFTSNKSADPDTDYMRLDLWRVPAAGGKVVKIQTFDGPAESAVVSPDGKWIVFRGWPDVNVGWSERDSKLWLIPAAGGTPRQLGKTLDRSVDNSCLNDTFGTAPTFSPLWSPDSSCVYSVVSDQGSTHIYRFDLESGDAEPVWTEQGVVLDFAVDFKAGILYCTYADQYNPGDVYSRRLEGGEKKRLTKVNDSWLMRRDLGQVEEVRVRTEDDKKVHGWVMTPPAYNPKKSYPGVLYIHGGPHMAYCSAFFHEFQYLAGQGYVVFYCNPRGSTSYGQAHKAAIARGWGDRDYFDVMKFTDYVLRTRPFIDRERVGVAGGSYGGYMTNWIIGHTHRFRAAISDRCVSNFMSFFGSSDVGYLFHKGMGFDSKLPWEERDRFIEMSPISHLHKAKTPTLVVHQEDDLRCPIEQGEQVYVTLKMKGIDTELLRFPQESHGMSRGGRIDRRIERLTRIKDWFDRYIGQPVKKSAARPKVGSNGKR